MAKKWITTKARALVYHSLQGSVAERTKHDASSMFTLWEGGISILREV